MDYEFFGPWATIYLFNYFYTYIGKKSVRQGDGIEFDSISRGTLLQILAAFEENIQNRMGKEARPIFTADFVNNRYTRPFIYPKIIKTSKI